MDILVITRWAVILSAVLMTIWAACVWRQIRTQNDSIVRGRRESGYFDHALMLIVVVGALHVGLNIISKFLGPTALVQTLWQLHNIAFVGLLAVVIRHAAVTIVRGRGSDACRIGGD